LLFTKDSTFKQEINSKISQKLASICVSD